MARRLIQHLDDDEEDRRYNLRIRRKCLRDSSNPFEIPEAEFINIYRMPQQLVFALKEQMESFMEVSTIPQHIRLLIAIGLLVEGTFQKRVGMNHLNCVSQSVVSRCIIEFCTIIDEHLMPIYIKFPQTPAEINDVKVQFYEKFNLPGVIGCIDCTHVSMFRPAKRLEHVYLNRHHYHSKNVQFVCSTNRILNVNASYGGSNHDATIWKKSLIKAFLHNKYDEGSLQNTYLLGDSGYPLQPWLMTPIQNSSNESEERYNSKHRKVRNCIERLNGVIKLRFRCLAKDRCIKYHPYKMGLIINTCATLHNFLKQQNFMDDHDLAQGEETQPETEFDEDIFAARRSSAAARRLISLSFPLSISFDSFIKASLVNADHIIT